MKKLLVGFICTLFLTINLTTGEAAKLEPNETLVELGGSFDAKASAKGAIPEEVDGKSGYKLSITHALNNNLSLQYKRSDFKSEEKNVIGITTHAKAILNDINLIYKANNYIDLVFGYEDNEFSYGKAVSPATKSTLHFGLTAHTDLNDKTMLFGTYLKGKDVSLSEIGIKYDLTKNSVVTVSYIERQVNDMDVDIDLYNLHTKADYKLSGLSLMYGLKF
ncbi:hypothetical protein [Anaerosinus gibii]|uniref:Uncharacterized protein n=1 Tax=Selenobaculum gibii TaxID=3054208 RepID=A0A9Y2EQL4_9FIRM|nr:hypothetical protein [Selenobaculum gbiensis]WIW70157.1 hypothetical protein P3F81_09675 [Selenobaculum gbiensis]